MRTINWTCVAAPDWQWMSSGSGNPGIPLGSGEITGSVTLSPDENYWSPCVNLVLQGTTTGNAMVRYYIIEESGGVKVDVCEAFCVAQGKWTAPGAPGQTSVAQNGGGFSLVAKLV